MWKDNAFWPDSQCIYMRSKRKRGLRQSEAIRLTEPDALEYFSGGVPSGEYFRMTLEDLKSISDSDDNDQRGVNRLQELCFIGLISYFEAFCKDHFAALVNIEPTLVTNLKAAGKDVLIDAAHVALYSDKCAHRLGFILANKFDFGTASAVNGLYGALLLTTPFSKDEALQFGGLLRDRHLLVHHGGTFTLAYLEQNRPQYPDLVNHAFFNSRTIARTDVSDAIKFIDGIAQKLLRSSHSALSRYIQEHGLVYSEERAKALGYLGYWGD